MIAVRHAPAAPALFPWLAGFPLIPVLAGTVAVVTAVTIALLMTQGSGSPLLSLSTRVRLRMWPGPGFARSRLELRNRYGLPAARKIARRRPSMNWKALRFGPWQQYAGYVGQAHGWLAPARVHTHFEQLRLVIAPPQKGKSAAAAGSIIDDPGPVVATSIRGDLIGASAGLRQRVGSVHVFNPEGAGNYGSTLTWNPVHGCEDMATAARRAGYMVEGVQAKGLDDASFWQDQASMVLASYLHAAALAAGSMRDVYRWVLDDDPRPAHILDSHAGAAEFAAGMARKYLALPDRTRAGVSTTLNAALRFMQDPMIVRTLCPDGPGTLDIPGFIASRDTLYLVAADAAQSPVPPVFTALLAEVVHIARHTATAAGRLDPPLTLELDEVTNIAPVPVAAWATYAAGSGIRIHCYVQSYSQLVQRWKEHGAETIWQSSDAKIIYSHTTESELCRRVEAACGQVRVKRPGSRARGSGQPGGITVTWENQPVLPAAVLRELPGGRAIVIQGGSRPVVVRPEKYWRRRDVRRFARAGGQTGLPAAPAPEIPAPDPELLTMPIADEQQQDPFGDMAGYGPFGQFMAPGAMPGADPAAQAYWPEDELAARRAGRGGPGAVEPWPETAPPGAWQGGYLWPDQPPVPPPPDDAA